MRGTWRTRSTVEPHFHTEQDPRESVSNCRAALLLPGIGDLARWGELGAYELLLKLPAEDLLAAAEVPALVALEHEDSHGVLLDTLTAFFDNASNIARVADALTIHRATLYQRLKRIEQITGRTLDNGDDRPMLHLGLKIRGLAAARREQVGGNPNR